MSTLLAVVAGATYCTYVTVGTIVASDTDLTISAGGLAYTSDSGSTKVTWGSLVGCGSGVSVGPVLAGVSISSGLACGTKPTIGSVGNYARLT